MNFIKNYGKILYTRYNLLLADISKKEEKNKMRENNFLKIVFLHLLRFMYQIESNFLALKVKVGIKHGREPCAIKSIKS